MTSDIVNVVSQLPADLQKLQRDKIMDINKCGLMTNHYIKGEVTMKFPLFAHKRGKRMKMILEDEGGKINTFCIDEYAEELTKCAVGDTVIVADAKVEKSPHYHQDAVHTHHIVIEDKGQPTVWVIPKSARTRNTNNASASNSVPPAVQDNPQPAKTNNQQTNEASSSRQPQVPTRVPTTQANQGTHQPGDGFLLSETPRRDQGAERTTGSSVAQTSTPSKSPQKRSYTYTNLKDVKETNAVDVYGVVKFFKPAYKTRGTDYCMVVTLIDPSLSDPADPDGIDKGLKCNLFRPEKASLPHIQRVGDIVRFHRLKVQKYRDELQGMCRGGFASLVFDGRVGSPVKPRSSTAEYTLTQEDKNKVKELQRWSDRLRSDNLSNPNRTLSDVFIGQYFDLTCQIVAKAELPSESCVMLKVWDGTKCQWAVREIDTSGAELEWDEIAAFSAEGLVVDVCLYDNHVTAGLKLRPGDYIRLYNLHALKYSPPGDPNERPVPMGEFCLHKGTSYGRGVSVMSQWEPDIKQLIRALDNANRNGLGDKQPPPSSTNDGPSVATRNQGESSSLATNHDGASSSNTNNQEALATTSRRLTFSKTSNQRSGVRSTGSLALPSTSTNDAEPSGSHCMQRSASVITDHFHIKPSSIAEVKTHEGPSLFRIRARLADFLPNYTEHFVGLYCPKCKFRCRVPQMKDQSVLKEAQKSSSDETSSSDIPQTRNLRSRSKRTDQPETSKRTSRNVPNKKSKGTSSRNTTDSKENRTKGETTTSTSEDERVSRRSPRKRGGNSEQDGSNENVSKVAKRAVGGHGATAEALPTETTQSDKHRTVRITLEDLSVQDALLLAHQGVKIQNHPVCENTSDLQLDPSSRVYYVCPRCSPADNQNSNDECSSLLQYKYCLKFFLEDNTDRIAVILNDKQAETFFKDVPPVNLQEDHQSKFTLEDYMKQLCPYPLNPGSVPTSSSQDDSHPWLDACIMSYQQVQAGQPVMKYHMFNTTHALDVD